MFVAPRWRIFRSRSGGHFPCSGRGCLAWDEFDMSDLQVGVVLRREVEAGVLALGDGDVFRRAVQAIEVGRHRSTCS